MGNYDVGRQGNHGGLWQQYFLLPEDSDYISVLFDGSHIALYNYRIMPFIHEAMSLYFGYNQADIYSPSFSGVPENIEKPQRTVSKFTAWGAVLRNKLYDALKTNSLNLTG